jgi:carboxyl-terminal processing protease
MAQHNARVQKDQEYQWLLQDVARFRSEREKKSISLNEAERRAERDRNEARRKEREAQRKAMGLTALDGDDKDDGLQTNERGIRQQVAQEEAAKNRPDPLLRATAGILADAIAALSGNPQLTAQVLPITKRALVWSQ